MEVQRWAIDRPIVGLTARELHCYYVVVVSAKKLTLIRSEDGWKLSTHT
jgi:hypothetical protein